MLGQEGFYNGAAGDMIFLEESVEGGGALGTLGKPGKMLKQALRRLILFKWVRMIQGRAGRWEALLDALEMCTSVSVVLQHAIAL